jgi:TetR/AcrR family transcriptional regulator
MDSREGLARAALTLFSSRGYDSVGVQEVASAANVSKPTLYHFFGSKHGILEQLFAEHATVLDGAVKEATHYEHDLPLTLNRIVSAYVDFSTQRPHFYRLELGLYFAPPESKAHALAAKHYAVRHASLAAMFQAATHDHGNFRGRHPRYAVSLVGMINSYVALQLQGRHVITDRVREEIVHQFSHGIYS